MVNRFPAPLKLEDVADSVAPVPQRTIVHSTRRTMISTDHVHLTERKIQSATLVHSVEFVLWDPVHSMEERKDLWCANQLDTWLIARIKKRGRRTDVIEMAMRHQNVISVTRHLLFELVRAVGVVEPGVYVEHVLSAIVSSGAQSKGSMAEPLNLYHSGICPLVFY